MPRILIDISHNEMYRTVPNSIFENNFIFDELNFGEPFPNYHELKQYDLLIIGEIIPTKDQQDHLFHKDELTTIKNYIWNGGSLLLSTSAGGDFNYLKTHGSIRALSAATGVKRFWWGELFSKNKELFLDSPEDLIIKNLPDHPIFKDVDNILFTDCTFFNLKEENEFEAILNTNPEMWFRYYEDDYEDLVGKVPIITARKFGDGKVVTTGSTLFMTNNNRFGIKYADNAKLFRNIVKWLVTFD